MVNCLGSGILWQITRSPHFLVVTFDLVFDYNFRTFLPISPPSVAPFPYNMDSEEGEAIQAEMQRAMANKESNEVCFGIFLKLVDTPYASLVPFLAQIVPGSALGWSWQQCVQKHPIRLTSSKFESWVGKGIENLTLQLEDGLKSLGIYKIFLTNALHVGTNESLHKTHVVEIEVELGHGLGEIKKLLSFKIVALSEMLSFVDLHITDGKEQLKNINLNVADDAPWLQEQRRSQNRTDVAAFPVAYRGAVTFYVDTIFIAINDYNASASVALSDKRAREAFQKLQTVQLPSVQSPELN